MQDKMLVSVVTVVFNGEKHLEQTIQSVLTQTYGNIEYIIIDGGSTDGTLDIIKKYEDRLAYWVSEPDNGISDAFNKGIIKATGEIIGILNADDWYEPDSVAQLVANAEKGDVFHGVMQYWGDEKKLHKTYPDASLLAKEMTINHPTVFVKKWVYEKYGVFRLDYRYAMDYELMLRFFVNGVKFYAIDSVLTNMRYEGVSDTMWKKALQESRRAKDENLPSQKRQNSLYFYKQFARAWLARFLQNIGLAKFVETYRKNFALVKKSNV